MCTDPHLLRRSVVIACNYGTLAPSPEKGEPRFSFSIFLLAGVTALALGASFVAEHFKLLSLVFGSKIEPYAYLLYPTMLASCMTALIWLLGMILVVMRDMKTLFWGSFAGLLLCVLLGALTIQKTVYFGTNLAVLASLALIAVIFLIRFFVYLFSKKEGVAVTTQDQQ